MNQINTAATQPAGTTESWQVPAFETLEFGPRRTQFCVCLFMINEGARLHSQLRKMQSISSLVDIILADGGSTDGSVSPEALEGLNVRTVLTKRGPGKLGAQMRMAFAYALREGYEGVIVVDGNDKDDVAGGLPAMIEKLQAGYDHVQGSRYVPGGHHANTPFLRHWGVQLLHAPLISLAAGFRYTDTTNGFRAYSKRLLMDPEIAVFRDELAAYELHYYLAIEAARRAFKVCESPVTRVYPDSGKIPTKISPLRGNLKVLMTLFKVVSGGFRPAKGEKHG
jgi:dolichol-phosphate mannosyltransferase